MEKKDLSKGDNNTPIKKAVNSQTAKQPILKVTESNENPKVFELEQQNKALLKQIEDLEKTRVLKPANIQDVINFYQEKKRMIDLLELLKVKHEQVKELQVNVKEQINSKDFEAEKFYLFIGRGDGNYKDQKCVIINNPIVIDNAIDFVKKAMVEKIEILETQIKA